MPSYSCTHRYTYAHQAILLGTGILKERFEEELRKDKVEADASIMCEREREEAFIREREESSKDKVRIP